MNTLLGDQEVKWNQEDVDTVEVAEEPVEITQKKVEIDPKIVEKVLDDTEILNTSIQQLYDLHPAKEVYDAHISLRALQSSITLIKNQIKTEIDEKTISKN